VGTIGVKLVTGILFLGFSCVAFFSMLHLLGAPHTPHSKVLRIVHRVSGAIAVILYVFTAIACVTGAMRAGGQLSPRAALHVTFGALFIPFILIKVVIVEKYPELRNRLFTMGTVLFAVVFVIFFTSITDYLTPRAEVAQEEAVSMDAQMISMGKELFTIKCAKCHRLDRALTARKLPDEWKATVEHMRQKDLSGISESEAEKIVKFLVSIGGQTTGD
jgi:hypothetical protein